MDYPDIAVKLGVAKNESLQQRNTNRSNQNDSLQDTDHNTLVKSRNQEEVYDYLYSIAQHSKIGIDYILVHVVHRYCVTAWA